MSLFLGQRTENARKSCFYRLEQVAAEEEEEEGFLQTEEFYVRPKSITDDTKNYNRDPKN